MNDVLKLRRLVACSDTVHMMIDSVPMGRVYCEFGEWWHVFDGFRSIRGPFRSRRAACRDFERRLPDHALALLVAQNRERSVKIANEFNAQRERLRLP